MLKKIKYSRIQKRGLFRPYLQVYFYNPKTKKLSSANLALVDSGADMILIPYYLGLQLGFERAKDVELLKGDGVAGSLYTVRRFCQICLTNSNNSKVFVFKSEVSWAHPNSFELNMLNFNINRLEILKSKKDTTELEKKTIDSSTLIVNSILRKYGTNVLLGREFFTNFDFVQFVEKKRGDSSKFIYKVRQSEIIDSVNLK